MDGKWVSVSLTSASEIYSRVSGLLQHERVGRVGDDLSADPLRVVLDRDRVRARNLLLT